MNHHDAIFLILIMFVSTCLGILIGVIATLTLMEMQARIPSSWELTAIGAREVHHV